MTRYHLLRPLAVAFATDAPNMPLCYCPDAKELTNPRPNYIVAFIPIYAYRLIYKAFASKARILVGLGS